MIFLEYESFRVVVLAATQNNSDNLSNAFQALATLTRHWCVLL
jgi:hypothetical protein